MLRLLIDLYNLFLFQVFMYIFKSLRLPWLLGKAKGQEAKRMSINES